jgi:hypothetical protein
MTGVKHPVRYQGCSPEAGSETCGFCRHAYRAEDAYWCLECDRPVCPVCAVFVIERRIVLCPECAAEQGDSR